VEAQLEHDQRPPSPAEWAVGRGPVDPGVVLDLRTRSRRADSLESNRKSRPRTGAARFDAADWTVFERLDEGGDRVARATSGQRDSSEKVLDDYGYEEELQEFLAADREPTEADPRFRDELRERLWAIVQDGLITRPRNH